MNYIKNDKVVLIKEMDEFKVVGETFEIANITETAIVLRDVKTKIALGAIAIDNFEQYFKKIVDVKGWTKWQRLINSEGDIIAFYRTNYKKVQVKTLDNIRAEASCNKCDEFNLYLGIQLAYLRCNNKLLLTKINEQEVLKNSYTKQIETNNITISKILKNLNKTSSNE